MRSCDHMSPPVVYTRTVARTHARTNARTHGCARLRSGRRRRQQRLAARPLKGPRSPPTVRAPRATRPGEAPATSTACPRASDAPADASSSTAPPRWTSSCPALRPRPRPSSPQAEARAAPAMSRSAATVVCLVPPSPSSSLLSSPSALSSWSRLWSSSWGRGQSRPSHSSGTRSTCHRRSNHGCRHLGRNGCPRRRLPRA
mmetsp:Transcript_27194/g.78154  ORF Transcript_27194/g.78154 Transcript_27194/m.78154 type:complete len:201 (-) Transcript_27194:475-1077(-)